MVWKARSHAAYQGYSHLSGMEMTSRFSMWNHSTFASCELALCLSVDELPCSSSHLSTSK